MPGKPDNVQFFPYGTGWDMEEMMPLFQISQPCPLE